MNWHNFYNNKLIKNIFERNIDWCEMTYNRISHHLDGKIIYQCCGDGSFARFIKDKGHEIYGFDQDFEFCKRAKLNGISSVQSDARFPPMIGDTVLSIASIGHSDFNDWIISARSMGSKYVIDMPCFNYVQSNFQNCIVINHNHVDGDILIKRWSFLEGFIMKQTWEIERGSEKYCLETIYRYFSKDQIKESLEKYYKKIEINQFNDRLIVVAHD